MRGIAPIYIIGLATFTIISSWIMGIRMRRRIKKDLGRNADSANLSSIATWMKVEDEEEKQKHGAKRPTSTELS